MGFWGPDAARERDYRQEMEATLGAQNQTMLGLFNRERRWQPAWSSLAMQNQNEYLWGAPERTVTVGGKTITTPGNSGLMGMYDRLVPQMQQWMTDPRTASMLDTMTNDAESELGLGTSLDPAQMRLVQQAVRGGQAARGMGFGNADLFGEALGISQFGQDLRNQRRAYAGDVVGLRQRIYGNTLGAANQMLGISSGVGGSGGPQIFNPESSYAGNLYASNIANDWARKQGTMTGMDRVRSISDTAGSFIGSVAGGMACWVAREVYGGNNPQWLQFRQWLLTRAPRWFREAYLKDGARVAEYLHDKPELKARVQRWMDARIRELLPKQA